jgi:beta-mannosidase
MDLSGSWRAARVDDELRRTGVGIDVDDGQWDTVTVPGHWRSVPAFAHEDGPLLLRRTYVQEPPGEGERRFVVFDGVLYQADVWLDGAYLGDPEGYFTEHAFDITQLSGLGDEHVLAVEVSCHPQRDVTAKRNITGILQHPDASDPSWNPGGLWRPVRIETTGPVRIDRLRLLCRDADATRAHVRLHGRFDADSARRIALRTFVDDRLHDELDLSLARGTNEIDWNIDIDDPRLWWPWSLGPQHLVDVRVEILVDGVVSHARTLRTGLREVALADWVLSVNGERLFLKGANLAPTRLALGEATPEEVRRDVELARDAGLDLLRIRGHIGRDELYAAADELGVLVWQDFPLQWGYARSVRRQAVLQARAAVDRLGHHPSIAMWCGHNEPVALDIEPGRSGDARKHVGRYLAGQVLPTWNRSILDRWVKRSFERADDSRPTIAHSGVLPHLPQLDGTDTHLWFGWHHGDERDLERLARTTPRLVRFVSEFGAQAVPEAADFAEPQRWPDLDWDRLERHHGLQREPFDRHVPPAAHGSFDSWRRATQAYQASLVRRQIETLRRLKYRPTGGFCLSTLNDSAPAVSWSVLDHERRPKASYQALVEACRPVIVVADRLPRQISPGQRIELDVHVVNDLRHAIEDAVVTAHATWPGGERRWRFAGTVEADGCSKVGTLTMRAPAAAGGQLVLDLVLETDTAVATNRDAAPIGG